MALPGDMSRWTDEGASSTRRSPLRSSLGVVVELARRARGRRELQRRPMVAAAVDLARGGDVGGARRHRRRGVGEAAARCCVGGGELRVNITPR